MVTQERFSTRFPCPSGNVTKDHAQPETHVFCYNQSEEQLPDLRRDGESAAEPAAVFNNGDDAGEQATTDWRIPFFFVLPSCWKFVSAT